MGCLRCTTIQFACTIERQKGFAYKEIVFSNKKFNLISIFKKFSKRYRFFMFVVVVLKYNNK